MPQQNNRRKNVLAYAKLLASIWIASMCVLDLASADVPNVLIVTVDDMSADSIGVFGCELGNTTPNIDAFAKTAMRFDHAHVLVGNCMPGRNIMWSGLYSHVNGVEGFQQNTNPDYPVLCDLAQQAGYFAAIRGKVQHSTPYHPYAWDAVLDTDADGKKRHVKDVKSYGDSTYDGITLAKQAGQPFCMMVNISDPHKPFYAGAKDPFQPSHVFSANEMPVPGFLPSDDVIRGELALYYSSVRRADDCFREIMNALEKSGEAENTFVMFLSDHGMPLPFAKTQLYHHSTHTPLLVRWPSVTKPDSVDRDHMVSAVDFLPTLLDVMETDHPTPTRLHGRSFAPILRGEKQKNRDHVVLQYNENSGRNRHPMRGIQTKNMLYLYNPWSDGIRKFATATTGTATYRQMVKRAPKESDIAARLQLFDHRVVHELYNIQEDPNCLINLIDSPKHANKLHELRTTLTEALLGMQDPVGPVLENVTDDGVRSAFMKSEDDRVRAAKAEQKKRRAKQKQKPEKRTGKKQKLIRFTAPEHPDSGSVAIQVEHVLPKQLGTQKLHVTLKNGDGKRIERKVVSIQGEGTVTVSFNKPSVNSIRFSAFVGEEYQSNLQHLTSAPVELKPGNGKAD